MKNKWREKEYRENQLSYRDAQWKQKISDSTHVDRALISRKVKQKFEDDPNYKTKVVHNITRLNRDPEAKAKRNNSYQKTLATTDLRKRMSRNSARLWEKEWFRTKVLNGMAQTSAREKMAKARDKQPRKSTIEDTLAKILTDAGIIFERNKRIAFYEFDFVIPRKENKTLLIEVNGDYWHTRIPHVVKNDKSKMTYCQKHLKDYELKHLWEHEFLCHQKVLDKIRYWIGAEVCVSFDLKDVTIRTIDHKGASTFLKAYHYLGHKAGSTFGAFLRERIIAVAVFSRPTRYESAQSEGWAYEEVMELSRFCIAPHYHKKNLASWFLSQATRLFFSQHSEIKAVCSFADQTVGHDGTIYKASNWKQCRIVPADYWYLDCDGHFMHKRTLYGHAVRMGMKEAEFAKRYGYRKVKGKKKIKFLMARK